MLGSTAIIGQNKLSLKNIFRILHQAEGSEIYLLVSESMTSQVNWATVFASKCFYEHFINANLESHCLLVVLGCVLKLRTLFFLKYLFYVHLMPPLGSIKEKHAQNFL